MKLEINIVNDKHIRTLSKILCGHRNLSLNPNGIEIGDSVSFDYTKKGTITFREVDEVIEVLYSKDGSYMTHTTCKMKDGKTKKFIIDKISNLRLL